MSDVLARAAGLFVVRRESAQAPPAAPDVVVIGADAEAIPVAAGIAAASGGVVALWPGCELPPGAAFSRARAAAERLDGHGFEAVARGRVAFAGLPHDPGLARSALVRLAGATEGPRVTAICGPRPCALDDVVAAHEVAVLIAAADADPDLLAAARTAVERLVPDARTRPPLTGLARLAALSGLVGSRLPPRAARAAEAR